MAGQMMSKWLHIFFSTAFVALHLVYIITVSTWVLQWHPWLITIIGAASPQIFDVINTGASHI